MIQWNQQFLVHTRSDCELWSMDTGHDTDTSTSIMIWENNIIQWCIYYFGKCLTCAWHTRLEHQARLVSEVWCYRDCETWKSWMQEQNWCHYVLRKQQCRLMFLLLYCWWRFVCHGILSLEEIYVWSSRTLQYGLFSHKLHTLLPLLYWWILFLFHDHVLVETSLYFDLENI